VKASMVKMTILDLFWSSLHAFLERTYILLSAMPQVCNNLFPSFYNSVDPQCILVQTFHCKMTNLPLRQATSIEEAMAILTVTNYQTWAYCFLYKKLTNQGGEGN
jgi:hypothetical protein